MRLYNNAIGVSLAQSFLPSTAATPACAVGARLGSVLPNWWFLASMPGCIYAQDQRQAITSTCARGQTSFDVVGQARSRSRRNLGRVADHRRDGRHRGAINFASPDGRVARSRGRIHLETLDKQPAITVNGRPAAASPDKAGYVSLDRAWKNGDVIVVDFPFAVRRVVADRRVAASRDRVAVERGPLVYCLESTDGGEGRVPNARIEDAAVLEAGPSNAAFAPFTAVTVETRDVRDPRSAPQRVQLMPYYLWANRGPREMTVWFARADYKPGDVGPAGGFIIYDNPNFAADGCLSQAAPFDQTGAVSVSANCSWSAGHGCRRTAEHGGHLAACTEPGSAADLCANLSVNGVRGWFLPSRDELALMYRSLRAAGIGNFGDAGVTDNFTYWASSQNTADMAAHIDFADLGRLHGDDKDFPRRVRAIRAF